MYTIVYSGDYRIGDAIAVVKRGVDELMKKGWKTHGELIIKAVGDQGSSCFYIVAREMVKTD